MRILCNLGVFFHGGRNSLSQSLTALPAPSGREPLAWRESCQSNHKAYGCAKAFPRSGEGGCERSEQTNEGAGKQLTENYPSSVTYGDTFPPRGEGFSGGGKLCGLAGNCIVMPKAPSQRGLSRRSRDWGSSSPHKQNHRSIRRCSGGFTITI